MFKDTLKFLAITIPCLILGSIPELIMWFTWSSVDPSGFWQKIVLLGLFWFAGGIFCILFAWLAIMLWAAALDELM